MKKWLILVLIVLFSFSFVNAYSKDKGLDWLSQNMEWSSDLEEEVSFALLALASNDKEVNTPHNILNQRLINEGGYFPSIKDTALAALALGFFNDDINSLLGNLSLAKANIGNWFIQITTNGEGTCTITYKDNSVEVTVNGNEKLEINGRKENWISVESYLGQIVEPIETVNVDCSDIVDTGMIISLLRIPPGNEFFIIDEKIGNNVNLVINNACYPENINGDCNVDVTFYTSWVLNKLGEEIKTQPYLEDKVSTNLHYAILADIIGGQNKYVGFLINNQDDQGEGGWDEDIITTSFAINTLRPIKSSYKSEFDNATAWLQNQQNVEPEEINGSFGTLEERKLETAAALYLALIEGASTGNGGTTATFCGDGIWEYPEEECDDDNLEDNDGCSYLCLIESGWQCAGEPSLCTQSICTSNLQCDINDNEVCDLATNTCVPKESATTCATKYDCPSQYTYECVNRVCRPLTPPTSCNFDWKCPREYSCINNDCQFTGAEPECMVDGNCETDEYCDTTVGICRLKEEQDQCGDGFCDFDEETSCPQDCPPPSQGYCEDGICQLSEEESGTCPEDCEVDGEFPFWIIWLLIILIILVGGGYLFYTKFLKKPKVSKGPSYLGPSKPEPEKPTRAASRRMAPRVSIRESSIERELDRSIKEAQKLLRRKK